MGFKTLSSWTALGGRAFVDFDCWKLRRIFRCLEGLSVRAFSVTVSSPLPGEIESGLIGAAA